MQSFKQNMLLLIKRYGISMKIDVNIDACKQGEREALGNLYKAYSDRLKRIRQKIFYTMLLLSFLPLLIR